MSAPKQPSAYWPLDDGSGPLRDVALALIGSQVFFCLMYMGGASAADLARIVASWKRPS